MSSFRMLRRTLGAALRGHLRVYAMGAALFLGCAVLHAQPSGLAATPPMGRNSWNHFAEKVTDADVRAAADAMVASGMKDAGYVYVNIDDGWQGSRDAEGRIQANSKFADMKALAIFNYVTDDEAEPQTVRLKDLGFDGPVHARDLWAHKDLGILRNTYTVTPPQGGVVMLRLWK